MKTPPSIRRSIRLAAPLACAFLALLPACSRKPLPKPEPEPPAEERATPRRSLLRSDAPAQPIAAVTPAPQTEEKFQSILDLLGPPATPEAAVRQAAELTKEFQAEREYLPKVEIAHRLADSSTPQAREALRYLFFAETDLDLRVQMVSSLGLVDSEELAPSLPILQEALKPSQPRELREAALDTIQSLNDPRTIPTLQSALIDPDLELRETAERTIEYLREVLQLEQP